MKLSVMQENLARGLQVVSRAVSSRSTLPVLANVLLRTEDAGLKLTATNLEIGITCWVPGKIDTDGALDRARPPARRTSSNSLPAGDEVDLELQGGDHAADPGRPVRDAHQGHRRRRLPGHPDRRASGRRRASRQKVLRQALEETAFAAASDEARPILTGVLARFEGDRLTLAAADNYRIAVKTIPLLDPVEDTSVVVPARSLHELIADPDRHGRPGRHRPRRRPRNQILFHVEGVDLVSRLIDGQFPNYQHGPAEDALHARRRRARRPAQGGPGRGADRELVGEHREAPGRAWTARPGVTVTAERGRRRQRGPGRGGGRGRRDHDRVQRALPRWRCSTNVDAEQFALELNGPLSPGVLQADRRRPVRPRGDAGPDAVLGAGRRPRRGSAGEAAARRSSA